MGFYLVYFTRGIELEVLLSTLLEDMNAMVKACASNCVSFTDIGGRKMETLTSLNIHIKLWSSPGSSPF